jgi:MFS transporter, PHS family, inorganic phosphate transporter
VEAVDQPGIVAELRHPAGLGRRRDRLRPGRRHPRAQAAGLVVGPLVASVFLASGVSNNLTWRLLLGLGAIPGLAVYYLRRQIHETPRFAMAGGAHEEAAAAIADATGASAGAAPKGESTARYQQSALDGYMKIFRNGRILMWLIGTAGAWLLLDFCYYGNTISQPEILKALNPHASLLHNTLVQLAIVAVFAVPGYIVAVLLMDKTGRKSICCSARSARSAPPPPRARWCW